MLHWFKDCRSFSGDEKTGSFTPNSVVHNPERNIAAILISKSRRGDFALSEAALKYVATSETEGKIKGGYVILQSPGGDRQIACKRAIEVYDEVSELTRLEGKYGPYFWINAHFQDATKILEEAPF